MEHRAAPLEMSPQEFRRLGHLLVDRIAGFLETIRTDPVTPGETPARLRALVGRPPLPDTGAPAERLLAEAADLVIGHSLRNGHPRFMGYITSSAAPIGALADFLAAAVNPNVGAWELAPAASEIEAITVRWIAELVGYPADCGGLLVSGGTVNTLGTLASNGALDLTSGTLNVGGTIDAASYTQSGGTLTGAGALNVGGLLTWSAGTNSFILKGPVPIGSLVTSAVASNGRMRAYTAPNINGKSA